MYKECDPKKCTANKLVEKGKAKRLLKKRELISDGVCLTPFAEKALSPEDKTIVEKGGIRAVDCTWSDPLPKIPSSKNGRALPYILATNPVNFGKPLRLTTAEALSASLYILGEKEEARALMTNFRWGEKFLEINKEPLERYSRAKNSTEVVEIQRDYL